VFELLLNDGRADPSANNNFAIQYASSRGHPRVVELLLKSGRVNAAANDNFARYIKHVLVDITN